MRREGHILAFTSSFFLCYLDFEGAANTRVPDLLLSVSALYFWPFPIAERL